jgi:hypothetical protein
VLTLRSFGNIAAKRFKKLTVMTKHIDLGAETVEFVRMRMTEVVGDDPENLSRVEWNVKEVKEQIFRLFYDYQVCRGWPHVAERTADVLGMSRAHVYELIKK